MNTWFLRHPARWISGLMTFIVVVVLAVVGTAFVGPTAPAEAASNQACQMLESGTIRLGASGPAVAKLQSCLTQLGFMPLGIDGAAGSNTVHAIITAQKYAGLGRDGVAGPRTLAWLKSAGPVVMPPQCGVVAACVDKARQVLFIQMDGLKAVDTATGNGAPYTGSDGRTYLATTPVGHATICRKIFGLHQAPLGNLYSPSYLDYDNDGLTCEQSGYAIHGSLSVPVVPASHGCARVTLALTSRIYAALPVGSRVTVF